MVEWDSVLLSANSKIRKMRMSHEFCYSNNKNNIIKGKCKQTEVTEKVI